VKALARTEIRRRDRGLFLLLVSRSVMDARSKAAGYHASGTKQNPMSLADRGKILDCAYAIGKDFPKKSALRSILSVPSRASTNSGRWIRRT
jgi:hypothetical protein